MWRVCSTTVIPCRLHFTPCPQTCTSFFTMSTSWFRDESPTAATSPSMYGSSSLQAGGRAGEVWVGTSDRLVFNTGARQSTTEGLSRLPWQAQQLQLQSLPSPEGVLGIRVDYQLL